MYTHRLLRNLVLACFVGGLAVASVAGTIVRISDDSPSAPKIERGRWYNVTYPLTVGFESTTGAQEVATLGASTNFNQPETFTISSNPEHGSLSVDGRSGRILDASYDASDPDQSAFIDALRRTLRYEPFNPRNAPWPYTDRPPLLGEAVAGPEPLSGVQTSRIMDSVCGAGDFHRNWRSYLLVCPGDGAGVAYDCTVHEADVEAFSRLVRQYMLDGQDARHVRSRTSGDCRLTP